MFLPITILQSGAPPWQHSDRNKVYVDVFIYLLLVVISVTQPGPYRGPAGALSFKIKYTSVDIVCAAGAAFPFAIHPQTPQKTDIAYSRPEFLTL